MSLSNAEENIFMYSSLPNKRDAWNNSYGVPWRPKLISVMHGITVMVYHWAKKLIGVMHGIKIMVYQTCALDWN